MKKYLIVSAALISLVCSCQVGKRLVTNKANSVMPMLFTSARDRNYEVYVMDRDSSTAKNLSNNKAVDYGLGWSPDGNQILFYSDRSGNEDIWRMNSDGSNPVNLSNHPSSERAANYSPDGQTIVFTSDRDNKTKDLYLMDSDGQNVRRLTHHKMYCESPEWTKDGKRLVFTLLVQKDSTDKDFNGELFMIDVNGKGLKRLTDRKGFDSGATISPNGKKIAFYGRSDVGKTDIFIMDIDGKGLINLTNDSTEDYSPSWSPDGAWLSFTSGSSANYDIWKMNVYTKEKIRLTSQPRRDETPYYKPGRK